MAFNDIPYLTFDKLKRFVADVKPYRGTTNKYPLGARRYKWRNFEWHGNMARVFYGNKELCVIHEDESVEITDDHLWQGQNMMLSEMFHNLHFYSNSHKGGDLISGLGKEHKIFRGLRVNLADNSVHKSTPYELRIYSLDREQTKIIREETKNHFNMIKAFFMAASDEQIVSAARSTPSEDNDAFTDFCRLGMNKNVIDHWSRKIRISREDAFARIKKYALVELYKERETFKYQTLPAGAIIPQGNWKVEVVKLFV